MSSDLAYCLMFGISIFAAFCEKLDGQEATLLQYELFAVLLQNNKSL